MEFESPTFNSLNRSQQRALIIRDRLRWRDTRHFDEFIEGITNDEPPMYRKINGRVVPPLALVTLSDAATRFDLGNVLFPEENNAVHRVYLTVEDGQVDIHTEKGLPKEDTNLNSAPIHGFIAKGMVPMFKDWFLALSARRDKINDARQAAYNTPQQPAVQFHDGETLNRLDPTKSERHEVFSHVARKTRKRKRDETVLKHVTNQHQGAGLDTIPNDRKSATFNTIPEHVKVDLFNNIVKTAFPNFDNLMVAAWNVVSVYSNVGTDFPDLHKSVVELKHVLLDFDEAFEMPVHRTEPGYRHEFDPASRGSRSGSRSLRPTPDTTQKSVGAPEASGKADNAGTKQGGNSGVSGDSVKDEDTEMQLDMPPPRVLQLTAPSEDGGIEGRPVDPRLSARDEQRRDASRPSPRRVSDSQASGGVISSVRSSPVLQLPRDCVPRARDQSREAGTDESILSLEQATSPELARRREQYASSIGRTNLNSAGVAKALRIDDDDKEQSEHEQTQDQDQATTTNKKKRALAEHTSAELRQKYHQRKGGLIRTYGSLNNIPQILAAQLQRLEAAVRARDRLEEEEKRARMPSPGSAMTGTFLGNSMLGAKKPSGMAPVAPMLHNRKEANGGNNAGSSPSRGGY